MPDHDEPPGFAGAISTTEQPKGKDGRRAFVILMPPSRYYWDVSVQINSGGVRRWNGPFTSYGRARKALEDARVTKGPELLKLGRPS